MRVEARGLTFDVHVEGPSDGAPVLLLHGFPQDHREFDLMLPRLHAAGLRTYRYDQRGYASGARPSSVSAYRLDEPALDVVAILDVLGIEKAHVIGHDWGAQVGWIAASSTPERVATLTAVSVPHPRALAMALRVRVSQRARFAYMGVFRASFAERLLLAGDGRVLRQMMKAIGPRAGLYADAMREPGRLTGGLNWYRALDASVLKGVGTIQVPTTYVWTDKDPVVGLTAALRTADWVDADYQLVALKGISHWVPEEAPDALADAALARIGV
jgi:pimeloyl-ACP methyl ester carboxylesterase